MPAGTDESTIVEYLAKTWSRTAFRPAVRFILADNDFIYLGRPDKFEIKVYSPAHFKTPVPAERIFSVLLFFRNGKAYCVATEDDYRYAKRYNYEIQEYRDNKWIRKK